MYKLYTVKGADSWSFLASWKQYTVYPKSVNLHKGPPSPLQKEKQNSVSDVSIFVAQRGGYVAQCRGNVLLCPNSDERKKCLVLFYLFTL
jgi:hypothetical protein